MKPLEGIKVVELATHVAVPMAARLLADWGAEVIKVENITGDLWRYYGLNVHTPITDEENPIFSVVNSNKKLISLNLKTQEGLDLLLRMLEDADVFMSNIRLPGLQRLGLDYDKLSQRFPQLVYFHFTGYGYKGPWADKPGFDVAAFWTAGGMINNWPMDDDFPFAPSAAFGDATVASMAASGILAGLIGRLKTGKGRYVTTSLYATALWYNFGDLISCQPQYGNPRPYKKYDNTNAFLAPYRCSDGNWIYLGALEYERNYATCCKVLGLEEYLDDPRYNTLEGYLKHNKEFSDIVEARFRTRTADEWVERFTAADIVIQKMFHASELYKSEHAWEAGIFNRVDFPSGHSTVFPNTPVTFIGEESAVTGAVGGIGCDTRKVLGEMGLSDEEISQLASRGVVRMPE